MKQYSTVSQSVSTVSQYSTVRHSTAHAFPRLLAAADPEWWEESALTPGSWLTQIREDPSPVYPRVAHQERRGVRLQERPRGRGPRVRAGAHGGGAPEGVACRGRGRRRGEGGAPGGGGEGGCRRGRALRARRKTSNRITGCPLQGAGGGEGRRGVGEKGQLCTTQKTAGFHTEDSLAPDRGQMASTQRTAWLQIEDSWLPHRGQPGSK